MSSGIRFLHSTDASIPTPPSQRAFLYYDDTLKVFKAKLDDGSIIILNFSTELVEDVVGNLINSSSTIIATYNDPANILYLEIAPNSINTSHVNAISPTKIVDAQNKYVQATTTTTNNSPTLITTFPVVGDGTYLVEVKVEAVRVTGLSGNPGDGFVAVKNFRVKTIGGVSSIHHVQTSYQSRDPGTTYNVDFSVSGSNVQFWVIGMNGQLVRWSIDIKVNLVLV